MNKRQIAVTKRFFAAMNDGDSFGFIFCWVPWKWVRELDDKIQFLHTDVQKHYEAKGPNPDNLIYGYWPFEQDWYTFRQLWGGWYVAHIKDHTRRSCEAHDEFAEFRSKYDQLRERFTEQEGGETKAETAKPWIETPPTEKTGPPEIPGVGKIDLWPIAIAGVAVLGAVAILKFKD